MLAFLALATLATGQQPPERVDTRPNDGEICYMVNQYSGLQAQSARDAGSDQVSQQPRSFTNLDERWAFPDRLAVHGKSRVCPRARAWRKRGTRRSS